MDIAKKFKGYPTGNVCDANNREGSMDAQIKPIDPASVLVGRAYTCSCPPGDNLTIHKAVLECKPGDVLVIDCCSYMGGGVFGELLAVACVYQGIAGVIIDGACRDSLEIKEIGLPVFVRGLNPGGTVKETLGHTGEALVCGSVMVNPGDIIVGDADGVVVVPQGKAEDVLAKTREKFEKENEIREQLKQGKTTVELLNFGDKLNQ